MTAIIAAVILVLLAGLVAGVRATAALAGPLTHSQGGSIVAAADPPVITDIDPVSGIRGSSVTITGTGFGDGRGTSTVRFNGTAATEYTAWSSTSITCTVPAAAAYGYNPAQVLTENGTSGIQAFVVLEAPVLSEISPASGERGSPVTISGTGFGSARGTSVVKFGSTQATEYWSWGDTSIVCAVPATAATGTAPITVTTAAATSNGIDFSIPAGPAISSVSPISGKRGAQVTISGAGFGSSRGSSAVAFGGTEASAYATWSDTSIVCTVPGGAADGVQRLTVTVDGDSSGVPFTVMAGPMVTGPAQTLTGQAAGDEFGARVAVDGAIAVIGAPHCESGRGAAYIYVLRNGTWTLAQKLTEPIRGANHEFGCAVAVCGDSVLIGSTGTPIGSTLRAGAAYLFTRSGDEWDFEEGFCAPDGRVQQDSGFGGSVALSDEVALVGAGNETATSLSASGAAYSFARVAYGWQDPQRLVSADIAASDHFGNALAVSGDSLLVGARSATVQSQAEAGAAYLFSWSGSRWVQRAKLTPSDSAAYAWFGWSVALYGDTALIGADAADVSGISGAGAAYVFTGSGATWQQKQRLTAGVPTTDARFGYAVALYGANAVIGADAADEGDASNAGAAFAFADNGTSWLQTRRLEPEATDSDNYFGGAVGLSSTGAMVGAWGANAGLGEQQGVVYAYPSLHADTVSPSTGVAGTQVTIEGNGFGELRGSGAVTFGSTPAAAYGSWTGSRIVCTVPAGLPLGACEVKVSTVSGDTSPLSFVVLEAPSIVSISPAAGRPGSAITVTGTGFGASRGASVVRFGSAPAASYASWTGTSIVCTVPADLTTGAHTVTVTTAGGTSNTASFTVTPPPSITSLDPAGVRRGDQLTIVGAGFGDARGSSTVSVGDAAAGEFAAWSDGRIVCTVPAAAPAGRQPVTVTVGGESVSGQVTVVVGPQINSVTPASAGRGATVTVSGAGFGSTRGTGAVRFGSIAARSVSWTDTKIVCKVPSTARYGSQKITVSADGASSTIAFRVLRAPKIARIAPAPGRRGSIVTISGSGFGSRRGASTVSFGSVKATHFTSWSDGRIRCRLPRGTRLGLVKVSIATAGGTCCRSLRVTR